MLREGMQLKRGGGGSDKDSQHQEGIVVEERLNVNNVCFITVAGCYRHSDKECLEKMKLLCWTRRASNEEFVLLNAHKKN